MAKAEFNPLYDQRNITDGDWINRKMVYTDNVYMVVPYMVTNIPFKSDFKLSVFLKKKGEIYGDALVYIPQENDEVSLLIFEADKLINKFTLVSQNNKAGEYIANLDEWTVENKGVYRIKVQLNGSIIDNGYEIIFK